MRALLFLAGALLLAAAPALSQAPAPAPAPPPPPSSYVNAPQDGSAQYRLQDPRKQCFNGRLVIGSNRAGDRTVYVQTKAAGVFRLDLKEACTALNAAERLTVRANGNDTICPGQAATLVLKTAAGPKRCVVGDVRHLNSTEIAELVKTSRTDHPARTEMAELATNAKH